MNLGQSAARIGRIAAEYYPDALPTDALWHLKEGLGVVANVLFSGTPAQVKPRARARCDDLRRGRLEMSARASSVASPASFSQLLSSTVPSADRLATLMFGPVTNTGRDPREAVLGSTVAGTSHCPSNRARS